MILSTCLANHKGKEGNFEAHSGGSFNTLICLTLQKLEISAPSPAVNPNGLKKGFILNNYS